MNYKQKLLTAARAYYRTFIPTWADLYFDQYGPRDVKGKSDAEIRDMIIRATIRWMIEDYAYSGKDNPEKVTQLFRDIYYQICGMRVGGEDFAERFSCVNEFKRH